MNRNSGLPDLRRLSAEASDYMQKDGEARKLKRKYNIGVAMGLGAIFLSVIAFLFMTFFVMTHMTLLYIAIFILSILLMIAVLIVAPIRLKRLQAEYFAGAGDAASEYIAGVVSKIKEEQQQDNK
jgi:Flp pilus assembly protein TadB